MNIQLVNKLRDSVNFFDDAEFLSLVSENSVLVKDTKTGSEWELPFEINESGKILFKGSEAELVTEAQEQITEESTYKKNVTAIMESISEIFDNVDSGVEKLSGLIKTVPFVSKKEIVTTESAEQEMEFFTEFKEQLDELNEVTAEFMENGKMFDADGDIRTEDFFEASLYKEAYEAKLESSEVFFENISAYSEFKDQVESEFESEVAQVVLESVDFSLPKDKFGMMLAKNLVKFKQINESEVDVLEVSRSATKFFESTLGQVESSQLILESNLDMKEEYYANRFTRFNLGIFKREDLVKINEELSAAMVSYEIEAPEDLTYINDLKMKIEYMERANQIDDELVGNILKDFNTRYGHDKSAQYRDESRGLGWKAPDRQKVTSIDLAVA